MGARTGKSYTPSSLALGVHFCNPTTDASPSQCSRQVLAHFRATVRQSPSDLTAKSHDCVRTMASTVSRVTTSADRREWRRWDHEARTPKQQIALLQLAAADNAIPGIIRLFAHGSIVLPRQLRRRRPAETTRAVTARTPRGDRRIRPGSSSNAASEQARGSTGWQPPASHLDS